MTQLRIIWPQYSFVSETTARQVLADAIADKELEGYSIAEALTMPLENLVELLQHLGKYTFSEDWYKR